MAKVSNQASGESASTLGKVTGPSKRQPRKDGKFSHGGARAGGGRKKGVPNKLTADIKTAILEAFQEAGGAAYLKQVALENPQVFCTLVGKVLPMQVVGPNDGAIEIKWSRGSDD